MGAEGGSLPPVERPDGRLYRPRKVVTYFLEDLEGRYALVLGTHDLVRAVLAARAAAWWKWEMYPDEPEFSWYRQTYVARGELGWVDDPVRGRAGVWFRAVDDDPLDAGHPPPGSSRRPEYRDGAREHVADFLRERDPEVEARLRAIEERLAPPGSRNRETLDRLTVGDVYGGRDLSGVPPLGEVLDEVRRATEAYGSPTGRLLRNEAPPLQFTAPLRGDLDLEGGAPCDRNG